MEVGLPDATLENRAESPLYGERARKRLVLEIYCEESRDVALVVVHVLELFKFNICIV